VELLAHLLGMHHIVDLALHFRSQPPVAGRLEQLGLGTVERFSFHTLGVAGKNLLEKVGVVA
jgi:hypothetical protein